MLASSIVIILIQNIYISLYCCYFIRALAGFKKPSINISVFLNLAMLWKAGNSQVGITLAAERVTRMAQVKELFMLGH